MLKRVSNNQWGLKRWMKLRPRHVFDLKSNLTPLREIETLTGFWPLRELTSYLNELLMPFSVFNTIFIQHLIPYSLFETLFSIWHPFHSTFETLFVIWGPFQHLRPFSFNIWDLIGSGVATGGVRGAECHPWQGKVGQKSGKREEKSGKNREEKAKNWKVLSLCSSWQIGLATLLLIGYLRPFSAFDTGPFGGVGRSYTRFSESANSSLLRN